AHAGPFHLDDARPQVGQLPGAEWRGNRVLRAQDSDAVKRANAGGLCWFRLKVTSAVWATVPSCSAHRRARPASVITPCARNSAGAINGRWPRKEKPVTVFSGLAWQNACNRRVAIIGPCTTSPG